MDSSSALSASWENCRVDARRRTVSPNARPASRRGSGSPIVGARGDRAGSGSARRQARTTSGVSSIDAECISRNAG